jgi:hypothetical protein
MRIYVYVSQIDPNIIAFTIDEAGTNLPPRFGPWEREEMPGIVVVAEPNDSISQRCNATGSMSRTNGAAALLKVPASAQT